jgi:hypothetical protein
MVVMVTVDYKILAVEVKNEAVIRLSNNISNFTTSAAAILDGPCVYCAIGELSVLRKLPNFCTH